MTRAGIAQAARLRGPFAWLAPFEWLAPFAWLTWLALFAFVAASAQAAPGAPSAPGAPAVALPPLRPHRFDEDWRDYCRAVAEPPALFRPKCIRLGSSGLLSVGGDLRVRLEAAAQPGFGVEDSRDRVGLYRAMSHLDLRAGPHLRAFAQLGSFFEAGRDRPRPETDEDRLDLVQGFVDLGSDSPVGHFTLRGGRQELSLGSARLVGVREGANVRRVFAGGRGFWQGDDARIDAFYALPVELEPGVFDDGTSDEEALYGLYATRKIAGPLSADLYWLGYEQDDASFAAIAGRERRHSFGLRLFGETERLDWDVEGVAQIGEVEDRDIRAWTIAMNFGVRRDDWALAPRFSLKADVASGDRHGGDGTVDTFNALYPRFPYFSEAILVVPANIIDVHLSIELHPIEAVTFELGWNPVWRYDTSDAIYAARLEPVAGTAGEPGRFTTHQTIVGVEWELVRGIVLFAQYVHAVPGGALRGVDGETVDFGTASLSIKY